jgi:hypothetical protein
MGYICPACGEGLPEDEECACMAAGDDDLEDPLDRRPRSWTVAEGSGGRSRLPSASRSVSAMAGRVASVGTRGIPWNGRLHCSPGRSPF